MSECLLHQTDLFRPHNDPDDHWDLACAFAIARIGKCPLAGVLIDHPPGPPILNHASDPDLGSVAQLSFLTGVIPPVAIGSPRLFSARDDLASTAAPVGVEFVLKLLRESAVPVAISIVGSARDVAEAIAREPELFAKKCSRIYLCAGNGCPDPEKIKVLEWNVGIDPAGYAQIFRAPCPIYWLPCLDDEDRVASCEAKPYASHFRFLQSDILPELPQPLQNFFAFMYAKRDSSFWLTALRDRFDDVLSQQAGLYRMMYSTPLFFDVAGLCVTTSGDVRPKTEKRNDWAYQFESIKIDCDARGATQWQPAGSEADRYVLHVLDVDAYPAAMTKAMRILLQDAFPKAL